MGAKMNALGRWGLLVSPPFGSVWGPCGRLGGWG